MGFDAVRKVWGLFALLFSAFLAYHFWTVYADYRRTLDDARRAAANAVFALEEHVSRAIGEVDWLLVSQSIACHDGPLQPREEEALHQRLERAVQALPQTRSILVMNAAGEVIAESDRYPSNHRSDADREYFITERDSPPPSGRWLSPLITARGAADRVVPFVMRLEHADGRFCGLAVAALRPDYFAEVFRKFIDNRDAVVSVRRTDGVLLLREPVPDNVDTAQKTIVIDNGGTGVAERRSPIDGQLHILAHRQSPTLPLVVHFGIGVNEIKMSWLAATIRSSLAGLVFLTLLGLCWAHIHRLNRNIETQRQRLRSALRSGCLGAWEWTLADGRLIVDERCEEILGYAPDQLSASLRDWGPLIHPADRRRVRKSFLAHWRGRAEFYDCENRLRHRDGHWVWVAVRGQITEWDVRHRPLRALGTLADISDRRRAEETARRSEALYKAMVSALSEGIVLVDGQSTVVTCNSAAGRIVGVPAQDLVGTRWPPAVWHSVDVDGDGLAVDCYPSRVTFATGRGLEGVVIGVGPGPGTAAWIEINTAPLFEDGPDRPSAVIVSFADITKRRAAEAELLRSNAELEQFAYAVSHDLRQPLRMVNSYLQLLSRHLGDALDEDARSFIGFARDGAGRMDRMLVALLEYSRVGRMGQPMAWLDSRAALEEALQFLDPVIGDSKAVVTVEGTWPRIFASGDEIERLFQNLLGNSLKYRRTDAPPSITVKVEAIGAEWRFSVIDDGIGIAPNQIGRLFKVFQRLHSNDAYEGSGVGLALCRKIVERHGGHIWAESDGEGKGSRFIFTLPAAQEVAAVAAEA